jgi:hypothetical protein
MFERLRGPPNEQQPGGVALGRRVLGDQVLGQVVVEESRQWSVLGNQSSVVSYQSSVIQPDRPH